MLESRCDTVCNCRDINNTLRNPCSNVQTNLHDPQNPQQHFNDDFCILQLNNNPIDSNNLDDIQQFEGQPAGVRYAPLGADNDDLYLQQQQQNDDINNATLETNARIRLLEEDQEILTTSLLALTTHFAQVQFRLQQIIDAPPVKDRNKLLKKLAEFAFRGIPETLTTTTKPHPVTPLKSDTLATPIGIAQSTYKKTSSSSPSSATSLSSSTTSSSVSSSASSSDSISDSLQREVNVGGRDTVKSRPADITLGIHQNRIEGKTDVDQLPNKSNVIIEKLIIAELKSKINFDVTDVVNVQQCSSIEDLRLQINRAIDEQILLPLKKKDTLVDQLKTQITDLERFVQHILNDDENIKHQLTKYQQNVATNLEPHQQWNSKILKNSKWATETTDYSTDYHTMSPESKSHFSLRSISNDSPDVATLERQVNSTQETCVETMSSPKVDSFKIGDTAVKKNRITFEQNRLKKYVKFNHYGDLRAQLEIDIQEILSICAFQLFNGANGKDNLAANVSMTKSPYQNVFCVVGAVDSTQNENATVAQSSDYVTDDLDSGYNQIRSVLTTQIRKNFAMSLKKLIEHGLCDQEHIHLTSLVPFIGGCFSNVTLLGRFSLQQNGTDGHSGNGDSNVSTSSPAKHQMHVWDLIMEYYYLKKGDQFNKTAARRLSQSFNLDIVNSSVNSALGRGKVNEDILENSVKSTTTTFTNGSVQLRQSYKQTLLSTICCIVTMHTPYKRSLNSNFKAFVAAGLNTKSLTKWLNLIFECNELIRSYYTDWSYVSRTGFKDALKSMEALNRYDFDIPIDLAIRQFQNIKDVFL